MACLPLANVSPPWPATVNSAVLWRGPCQSQRVTSLTTQLETLLRCFAQGYPPSVKVPSVMALADFYRCDALALLASLNLLHQHAYDYRMMGLDLPLELVDPLGRFRCRKSLLRKNVRRRTA